MGIEQKSIDILELFFTSEDMMGHVVDVQDFFADDADELDVVNPEMADYLQDIIPEYTADFGLRPKEEWLAELRNIIDKAKTFIK